MKRSEEEKETKVSFTPILSKTMYQKSVLKIDSISYTAGESRTLDGRHKVSPIYSTTPKFQSQRKISQHIFLGKETKSP